MHKTLKYRLYRSKLNKHLVRQIESAVSVWNHSVALSRRYYPLYGKHLSVNRLMKHIAKLRRRNPYWQCLGSQAVQDVCQRLDKSYQRFFKDRLKDFLTDNEGKRYKAPEPFKASLNRMAQLSSLSQRERIQPPQGIAAPGGEVAPPPCRST